MSLDQRAQYEADWRRQQEDNGIIVGAITVAIFATIVWIIGRAAYFFNAVPGRDFNGDGVFSITDTFKIAEFAFNEPAWHLMSWIPYEIWRFFEITSYNVPGWLVFLVAVACWIAVAIGISIACFYAGKAIVYLGKGANVGIGKIQVRLPQLMGMDILIIGAVFIVVGGFALGALINSFAG
jgi:hypothetical protein